MTYPTEHDAPRTYGTKHRVEVFSAPLVAWVVIARFAMRSDALAFARSAPYKRRRVGKGRNIIASYSGEYVPTSAAAGDLAAGEGTGAPDHQ